MSSTTAKDIEFAKLTCDARACRRCSRMNGSVRVLGPGNGRVDAPIFIIGEAPGRLGADASAIPFHGDRAGDNFESLLAQVGLSRHECFITNAALCNPKDSVGNNATPTREELDNCSSLLRRQLDLVNPRLVVTLGGQALTAIKAIEHHEIELSTGVRKAWNWYGRQLIPLYHPGQRAMIHRSFFNQLADYQFLAETFARQGAVRRRSSNSRATPVDVANVAKRLATKSSGISYFAFHKLFYLTEYEFCRRNKKRMTSAYIVRQKEGPYVFEMHIKKLKKAIPELRTWSDRGRLMLRSSQETLFEESEIADSRAEAVIEDVLLKYSSYSEKDLKRVVYLTSPMRDILRTEKRSGLAMFNRAIDFTRLLSN